MSKSRSILRAELRIGSCDNKNIMLLIQLLFLSFYAYLIFTRVFTPLMGKCKRDMRLNLCRFQPQGDDKNVEKNCFDFAISYKLQPD
jgi:hypothetical protein